MLPEHRGQRARIEEDEDVDLLDRAHDVKIVSDAAEDRRSGSRRQ
jgi:hypothetical protein